MSERLRVWHWLADILFGRPQNDIEAPDSRDRWREAISRSNLGLVTAILWERLRHQPALTSTLPDDERDYLEALHDLTASRNAAILEQLSAALSVLADRGIRALPLKGAAYLLEGLADAGIRHTSDIDLLVPDGEAARAREILLGAGYADAPVTLAAGADHHHLVPLVHPEQPAAIELHTHVVPEFLRAALSESDVWSRTRTIEHEGLEILLPHATDLAAVSFLHAELVDLGTALWLIPLRQFCDLAMLQNSFADTIDWSEIRERAARVKGATRLKRYAYVYEQLSGDRLLRQQLYSPLDSLSYRLSLAAMERPWITRWRLRANRLSERRLRRKYKLTGGFLAVNAARTREVAQLLANALSRGRE